MMQNSDDFFGDKLFQDLLADYAAPVEDDGFTQKLLENVEAETKRVERIRRVSIYGACFTGGVIAAAQLPALVAMAGGLRLALPAVPNAGGLPISTLSLAAIVFLGFVLWAALDRQAAEIF